MRNFISYLQLLWLIKSPPALFSKLFGLAWYRDMLVQWVAPLVTSNAKVLEVGCASGDFARSLAERNNQLSAVDRSASMIMKAKKVQSTVKFVQADATSLPFPDQYFDVVLAASLINIVDSPLAVLSEMKRVCRKGGIVSILVPNKTFKDADAKRHIKTEQLSGLSKAAYIAWYKLARKMDNNTLSNYYKAFGLKDVSIGYLLSGMVITISGKVD